ncbi:MULTISPECIES: mitofilin family membrane protein [unclassified Sinorhizobium]|uniref:mitofilin family membrane protein n=1 Tax=unclassified Sinorhizobium TaxID=2613772 RepID=UPI003523FC69
MVSGNSPRHSKNNDEPVTLDLEANEPVPAADPEKLMEQNPSDPGTTSATEVEVPFDAESEPLTENESERATDAQGDSPQSEHESPSPPREERPVQKTANISGLIAAGIFGGLVALAGAGSMQYAGLLPSSTEPQTENDEVAALAGDIEGLKQEIASLAAAPAEQSSTNQNTEALEARIAALEAAPKGGDGSAPADPAAIDALNRKIADLSSQIEQLRASVTQTSQDQASVGADISKRLEEAERKLDEPREDVAVAKAIAAAALKAAIDRGGPFLAELDTFAGVAPDDPTVADLRSFAATGVQSRADLIRQSTDVATAIVEAANQPDPNQGWTERLMASAQSLVKVRPVGNIEGDSVEAIAARMEDKVKNGDLQGAAAEWNDLPEAGKAASAAFKQSLEARIRVEDLVGGALSKAVAGAGRQG